MGKKFNSRRGFTMVEVSLVLAITSLLVVGVMTGTSASLARQRYSDAMTDIAEKLRQVYSEVVSVQNSRSGLSDNVFCSVSSAFQSNGVVDSDARVNPSAPGRTGCAIYGKLVTIGEWTGEKVSEDIRVYDIVGDVYSPDNFENSQEQYDAESAANPDFTVSTETTERAGFNADANIQTLRKIGANSVTLASNNNECGLAAINESVPYVMPWSTKFETTSDEHKPFRGAIVIFRSPLSGTVQTYYADYSSVNVNYEGGQHLPIDINYVIGKVNAVQGDCKNSSDGAQLSSTFAKYRNDFLQAILGYGDNEMRGMLGGASLVTGLNENDDDLTMCVGSEDAYYLNNNRRGIRILKGGRNATAIELLNADVLKTGEDNPCQ